MKKYEISAGNALKGGGDTVIMAVTGQRDALENRRDYIMAGQTTETKYRAALYCRLSKDDGNVQESSSIHTQKEMLSRYADEHGIKDTAYYVDDGFSGVSFDRPAFKRMIGDIESGKINCVITKDLSRLGRNYLETGVYIEIYFPEHHVRYIAVNDVVDTNEQESADFTPFRNIINELYAKDTSKKVKSAKRARVLDGMYVATSAPYGYKKDPDDRHRLVIDERYAPTVRMIFSLAKDGMGISQIRNYINGRHILRPSAVNPNGYGHYFDGEDDPKRYKWSNNSVRGILRNPVYAGHLVMGKRVRPSFKSHKSFSVLPENYKVVRDVHQPIVDPEDFELVQRMITSRRSIPEKPRKLENIFSGLIKCADCGYAMTLAKAHRSPKAEVIDEYGYMCNNYKTFGKSVDTSHWIEARQLYDCVLNDIRKHAAEALADNDELCRKLAGQIGTDKARQEKSLEKELRAKKARLSEVDNLFQSLYEDKLNGNISERNYLMMGSRYEKEQAALEQDIVEMEKQREESGREKDNIEQFTRLIKDYAGIEELSAALLNTLIEKVTIGEPKESDGERIQEVKIYYKFIGNID